jgi:hypothetical protein
MDRLILRGERFMADFAASMVRAIILATASAVLVTAWHTPVMGRLPSQAVPVGLAFAAITATLWTLMVSINRAGIPTAVDIPSMRAGLMALLATILLAVGIRWLGLLLSASLAAALVSFGTQRQTPRAALVVGIAVGVGLSGLLVLGLRVPLPLWPALIGG